MNKKHYLETYGCEIVAKRMTMARIPKALVNIHLKNISKNSKKKSDEKGLQFHNGLTVGCTGG